MTDDKLAKHNAAMLRKMNPTMTRKVVAVMLDMRGHGYRVRIDKGVWRSPAEQLAKFKAGVSKVRWGFHCATNDDGSPGSLAADLLDDDNPTQKNADRHMRYALLLAASAASHNCQTGILWGLSHQAAEATRVAIRNRDWDAMVRLGWDSLHVEPAWLTVAQAKAGQR